MATYKVRGTAHNIIYPYRDEHGKKKQQWETYTTELEAMQRKALIDYLQNNRLYGDLLKAVLEYKRKKALERAVSEQFQMPAPDVTPPSDAKDDNMGKTYREFADKWLPFHARKKRFSPNSFDSYRCNLDNHILPYFGERVMSTITSEDIDDFLDYLSQKPCKGAKSYNKRPDEIPTLSSSSVKKCYTVLTSGFETALKWHYIASIPVTTAPAEKTVKRRAWDVNRVRDMLGTIKDDPVLHLAVHLAFVCSLRAGEIVGIDWKTIDFRDGSLWITRQVQRVSDRALGILPKNEIIRVFPKLVPTSKSSLILKGPKTEDSHRKQYLTRPLLEEIRARLAEIEEHKAFFREEYQDYGLLLCQADGRPLDPKSLEDAFKLHQIQMGIPEDERVDIQGLRKSGQMHKVRLTKNDYQLVAESAGQSPEVLMNNYNEALDSEKRALSRMVEGSFYPDLEPESVDESPTDVSGLLDRIQQNPELRRQIVERLLMGTLGAERGA